MEKYSAFRDPGTGIQPFLTPVPPIGSDNVARALLPIGYVLAVLRTAAILAVALMHLLIVDCFGALLGPIPLLGFAVTRLLSALLTRLALLLLGLWWIPVEHVTRKRARGKTEVSWSPKAGDIIVSNWASWVELLWLTFRFNPQFVLPVVEGEIARQTTQQSGIVTSTPGRRTGTGSAALSSPAARTPSAKAPIVGWRAVSLLTMIKSTGGMPVSAARQAGVLQSLDSLRRTSSRPLVVFPECTTSNARGLLRFADVFKDVTTELPVKGWRVWVVCVRYDPPTGLRPSLAHSVPTLARSSSGAVPITSISNPLSHVYRLTTSLVPLTLSIRLLSPAESPSSATFVPEDITTGRSGDPLAEACAALIAQIGKMKRVGLGWEDKGAFLDLYSQRNR